MAIKSLKRKIIYILYIASLLSIGYFNLFAALTIVCLIILFLYANKLLLKSDWWHNKYHKTNDFLAQPLFREDHRRNFDIINLGSLISCNNFSYKTVYGLNLSSGKQSFNIDYQILKFYHSYLKKNGYVAIVMNPYEYVHNENFIYYSRFIKPLDSTEKKIYGDYYKNQIYLLETDKIKKSVLLKFYMKYPLFFDSFNILAYYIHKILNYTDRIKIKQKNNLSENDITTIQNMIEFCIERNYRPFIVISPVQNKYLNNKIETFSLFIKNTFSKDITILDYTNNHKWSNNILYDIPNCLKKDYREEFTKLVFTDIKNIYNIRS